jgi:hypothetical protein
MNPDYESLPAAQVAPLPQPHHHHQDGLDAPLHEHQPTSQTQAHHQPELLRHLLLQQHHLQAHQGDQPAPQEPEASLGNDERHHHHEHQEDQSIHTIEQDEEDDLPHHQPTPQDEAHHGPHEEVHRPCNCICWPQCHTRCRCRRPCTGTPFLPTLQRR